MRASNVVEDARDSAVSRPSRQGYGWLGAGLLVGAGLTVLFLGVNPPPESTTSTVGVGDTRIVAVAGIAEVIPGFPDGLVAARRSDGQSLELVIWPEHGDLRRSVPVGVSSPPDPVAFDVSGRLMATLLPAPGSLGGVLYAGVPDAARDHLARCHRLRLARLIAVATCLHHRRDGETLLWVTGGNLAESELVAQAWGSKAGVAAWGDWGYAVQDGETLRSFTERRDHQRCHGPGSRLTSDWLASCRRRRARTARRGGRAARDRRDDSGTDVGRGVLS